MAYPVVTASIGAASTMSDWMYIKGYFNLSIWGTWAGTLRLQRSFNGGGAPQLEVDTFTANSEEVGFEPEGAYYRAGFTSVGYISGTVNLRLAADPTVVKNKIPE